MNDTLMQCEAEDTNNASGSDRIKNPYSLYLNYKKETAKRGKAGRRDSPKSKKKKKMKFPGCDDYDYNPTVVDLQQYVDFNHSTEREGNNVPDYMQLNVHSAPGFVFGLKSKNSNDKYVGMPQGADGNILVVGGNGSGKSSGVG